MTRTLLLPLLLLFIQIPVLAVVEFSEKEKSIIYTNAIKVLEDYQNIINRMGESVVTDIEKAESEAENFLELFVNRQVLIYNDLDPTHKLSEFYEAETYSSNVLLWYPDGITIKMELNSARVSEIMRHEENVFSIDILAKKAINGNYLNQTMNKNTEDLTFRIAFGLEGKKFVNFKIVGIRNASSSYVIDFSKALKEVNSVDINAEDLLKIQSEIKKLVKDYSNFLSLIGDPKELAEEKEFYRSSLQNLFQSADIKIYNDIEPNPQSSLVSVSDYLNAYVAEYPNGIKNLSINADSVKLSKVMKSDDGRLFTYTDINKFFSGSYKGKEAFRKMFPLVLKISFTVSGKVYTDFKIASIDISSANFYQELSGNEIPKPAIVIKPVTRRGLVLSLIGSFGQTGIIDNNIESLTLTRNLHSWKVTPLYGFTGAIGVYYYFNDNLAAKSGIELSKYAGKFSLQGTFTDNTLSPDINNSMYYKIIEADYDSLVNIKFITIPMLISYSTGKPGKFGFYVDFGSKISIPISSSFTSTGSYKFTGYYPSNPTNIQYIDVPELGFYNKQNINETGSTTIKGVSIALYSSFGVNIPLGYYSSVGIGPEATISLSDIFRDRKTYTDIFGRSYSPKPVKVRNYGLRISYTYKF